MELTNLLSVAEKFPDEKTCRDYLIKARWGNKIKCIHCGYDEKIYRINDGKRLKCAKCRKQFTAKVGTMFEDSAIPLRKWFFAIFILSSHKKGISSCQLARDIKVTQKTAWFMLQRIRHTLGTDTAKNKLTGKVEVDEGFIGKQKGKVDKAIVLGMVERNGRVKIEKVKDIKANTLQEKIRENVDENAIVITDESASYNNLNKDFFHLKINHSKRYANGMIHTNNIESFWGMLKRGIYGIYHSASAKHIQYYCNEFSFRHNTREYSDSDRFLGLLNNCSGKIKYQDLIDERQKAS